MRDHLVQAGELARVHVGRPQRHVAQAGRGRVQADGIGERAVAVVLKQPIFFSGKIVRKRR